MSPAKTTRSILMAAVLFSLCGGASLLRAADAALRLSASPDDCKHVASIVDSGDNAWVLISSALVLMMTGPGLALFYCGWSARRTC